MLLSLILPILASSLTAWASVVDDGTVNPLGPGQEGFYSRAAVASDTTICSSVGKTIMKDKGGNAVDAAISTLICIGTTRFQSSGLGGDSAWTIYERKSGRAYSILSRSMASLTSNATMFTNRPGATLEGGLSVAVPGEVMGFWEAHKRFGRLPWKDLFKPTIDLSTNGFPCDVTVADSIKSIVKSGVVNRWPTLRQMVTNPVTNTWYKAGETVKLPLLARTLTRLADGGAPEFYNGSLADEMVEEIQGAGGIISKEDYKAYWVDVTESLKLHLNRDMMLYTPGLPSGGPVLQYILNILTGYNLVPSDLSTNDRTVLTYHRMIEAFKHAYAARSRMGSPYGETEGFVEQMKQLVLNITSPEHGATIKERISDSQTYPWTSYNPSFQVQENHGTSNLAVLNPDGDAVAVTSTINTFFGSKVVGTKTGIIYNNMMDDFSIPGVVNMYGVQPSPANFIKPGKRPLSSMSPTVVVNKDGLPVLTVGAAGGTKIITTNAFISEKQYCDSLILCGFLNQFVVKSQLTAMTLWLSEGVKSAIDAPRIHHQLYPDQLLITNAPQWLVEGLKQKGHHVSQPKTSFSEPTGILQRQPGYITASAQVGIVDGF